MRRFLPLLLCILLVLTACQADKGEEKAGTAPDFTLNDTAGNRISLAQFRGKVVFLNFWATWCPPCREELPSMERLNEVFSGRDFVMLAVNAENDGLTTVAPFLEQYPHRFTVLLDVDGTAQELYGVDRFPETFVIGKDGKVVQRLIGSRDWSSTQMLSWFDGLVGGH